MATTTASAHPIVSTDINRHVTLEVSRAGVTIHYRYNMLEIAAVNIGRSADLDADGQVSDAERTRYAQSWADELIAALHVSLDDQRVALQLRDLKWELGPAPFGLHTWTLIADVAGTWTASARAAFRYGDGLRPGETGWKEVVLHATDVQLTNADVLSVDRSARLTDYQAMADLPNPEQSAAHAQVVFDAPARGTSASAAIVVPAAPAPARGPQSAGAAGAAMASTAVTTSSSVLSAALKLASAAAARVDPSAPPHSPVTANIAPDADRPSAQPSPWQHYALPFFRLGMHHIAIGWDHLAFLLGLLLFRQKLSHLAWVVSAFTLAHSLTLALAGMGWVNPPGPIIETLIAMSIVYVGVLALWRPDFSHGPWLAFGFGLVHGFGFAGALSESLGELGGNAWLVALASFNLGIEVLQLLLVAGAFGLLQLSDRMVRKSWPRQALAGVVIVLGAWWSAQRIVLTWSNAVAS